MSSFAPSATAPPRAGLVLTALLVSAVVCNVNTVVAGLAVPLIGAQFDASQTALNLVALATGFGLSASVRCLGARAERYGPKQLPRAGVALTVVGPRGGGAAVRRATRG